MNSNEFDPNHIDPTMTLTDDQRLAAQQAEDQRIGDENEANGLNRDGSPIVPPTPPVAPSTPAPTPAVATGPVATEVAQNPKIDGLKDAPAGDTSLSTEALLVKNKLAGQPKMPIFLPLEAGERRGVAYRSVTINGYRCEVKKGMMVHVPQSIYEILMNSMNEAAESTEIEENLDQATPAKRRALDLE